jgi:ribosomal-protein-alanine N-acetyltransferase
MNQSFPELNVDTYRLREIVASDIENIYSGLSHPDVIRYYGVNFSSLEATEEQMEFFDQLLKTETGIWWAICAEDNTTFYGACGFNNLSKEHQKAEVGFWLLPEHWGKGIIPTVVPHICRFAFSQLDLHRIEAFVESENKNSKRAMHKLSFQYEGCMRECEVKNGKFIDVEIYSLLKSVK